MLRYASILVAAAAAVPAALAAPSAAGITITAQPRVVTYGSPTMLSGTVTSAQKVSVDEQPCGATTFKNLGQPLSVSASGAWSLAATPTMRTVYRAKAKSATADVTVAVRPKVSLTKIGAHRFSVRIVAARSFAQRIALFQRRSPAGWRTVKSIPLLNVISGQTAPTMISGKDFRSGVAPGRRVRILLTQAQVGGCYAPGTSNTIRS